MFELAQYGLPAVLIPYPHASADHQTANARWMAEAGAATILPDAELTPQRLRAEVDDLLADPERLAAMAAASRRSPAPTRAHGRARGARGRARESLTTAGSRLAGQLRTRRGRATPRPPMATGRRAAWKPNLAFGAKGFRPLAVEEAWHCAFPTVCATTAASR